MNLEQFEKKVTEFALKQGWIPITLKENDEYNFFHIRIESTHNYRRFHFSTTCENVNISISIESINISNILEAALRMIKAYSIKTRIKKETEE